ncbi:universal stress protein [Streptomyces sp. VRA16 Mangrove soil]|uniref:universal stress protein n=1 Tax=Streptomyces sp. VRA16 Mangrove soil TaxID=2817434 RepID=UPI001A9E67F1|nr:universal stress protein [Streptomyces sp. VRA16 Mangrove soil]MBO1332943.1 universal stress protein [Streptomyces sp. VRA16 Mangrove soil]
MSTREPQNLPVVVAVDGSDDSRAALEWALAEAVGRGADLRVVHVRQYAPFLQPAVLTAGPEEPVDDPVIGDVRKELEGRSPLPPLEFITREGAPAAVLPAMGAEAQLLVLGSRGRGGFASLLLGSNGVAAARDAACPVVVVRAREESAERIVVGLQPDDPDETTLAFAVEHAARAGAPLRVVAAYPWPVLAWSAYGDFAPAVQDQEIIERETLDLARRTVQPFLDSHPEVEVEVNAAPGDAAGRLVDSSEGAALVVVGRHRRRVTRPAPMLGSVTHAVLLHAKCPVAVVPPTPEEAEETGETGATA